MIQGRRLLWKVFAVLGSDKKVNHEYCKQRQGDIERHRMSTAGWFSGQHVCSFLKWQFE
jgi:hypothetical protein